MYILKIDIKRPLTEQTIKSSQLEMVVYIKWSLF
jgi:hypothetical protein